MNIREIIKGFRIAVLSIIYNGYPLAFPIKKFDVVNDRIILARPKGINVDINVNQRACLLFHTHDKYVKNIRYIRIKGLISKIDDNTIEFTCQNISTFKQGGLISTIKFILKGKRRAMETLKKYYNVKQL